MAYHYQDDALAEVSGDPLTDQYSRARKQVDAKVSYRFNESWAVFAEGKNLNDAPYRTYVGYSRDSLAGAGNAYPGYLTVGRTYYFGLNYSFGNF